MVADGARQQSLGADDRHLHLPLEAFDTGSVYYRKVTGKVFNKLQIKEGWGGGERTKISFNIYI